MLLLLPPIITLVRKADGVAERHYGLTIQISRFVLPDICSIQNLPHAHYLEVCKQNDGTEVFHVTGW